MRLILASTSPRRRELLSRLELQFEVIPSHVDERAARPGEDPRAYALELATAKAHAVAQMRPRDAVLAADTVVALQDEIFGKPVSPADAARMLHLLGGQEHLVCTAVVVRKGADEVHGVECTRVRMRDGSASEIDQYVETGEPMDKAGAYAIQGIGASFVSGINGCLSTVVGLPLCLTARLLREMGVDVQADPSSICTHRDDLDA